jgi:hypothetical protein
MNDYFIRCRQQDVPGLYALATALGVLTPIEDSDAYTLAPGQVGAWDVVGPVSRPTGEVIYGEPFEQPVYAEVITQAPHPVIPDFMVQVSSMEHTGEFITVTPETIVTAVVVDEDGVPYWHANLRLEASLMEIAQAKARVSPAVAAGLSSLARWFVVGEDGRAKPPKEPAQVWL